MSYLLARTTLLFSRLKVLFPKSRRFGWFSFVFVLITGAAVWFLSVQPVSAWSIISLAKDSFLDVLAWVILLLATLFMKMTIFMLDFVIEMGGYNGFINSDAVKVGWVMVRDVANMFFVVILLIIAFATILGIESYEWKKLLPKFILAAILVNFSRVICGLIIDASQVIMITFINGVAATAGTNLIKFFNLDEIQKLTGGPDLTVTEGNVFMAAVGGLTFAALAMGVMAIYVIILVARIVVLWVLIVLSPLAFVLSVIPHTQKYASQWWTQFGGQVIVGPVLAFFLWLSFVTLTANTEGINAHIAAESTVPANKKITSAQDSSKNVTQLGNTNAQSGGITEAMTWHKMANFAIAIGMLIVGAKAAQQTGAVGGDLAGGAINFGKRVATIASGVAAGLWLAKGAGGLGLKGIKKGLYYAPFVGGEKWALRAKNEWANIKSKYKMKGMGINKDTVETSEQLAGKRSDLDANLQKTSDLDAEEEYWQDQIKGGQLSDKEREVAEKRIAEIGDKRKEILGESGMLQREQLQGDVKSLETKLADQTKKAQGGIVGGLISRSARSTRRLEKQLKKSEGLEKSLDELFYKRTGSEAGGIFINRMSTMRNAMDRWTRGAVAGEDERSKAKDQRYEGLGRAATLAAPRLKYDMKGNFTYGTEGVMADQIAEHKDVAAHNENWIKAQASNAEARIKILAKVEAEVLKNKQEERSKAMLTDEENTHLGNISAAEKTRAEVTKNMTDLFETTTADARALITNPQTSYNQNLTDLNNQLQTERDRSGYQDDIEKRKKELAEQLANVGGGEAGTNREQAESNIKALSEEIDAKYREKKEKEKNKESTVEVDKAIQSKSDERENERDKIKTIDAANEAEIERIKKEVENIKTDEEIVIEDMIKVAKEARESDPIYIQHKAVVEAAQQKANTEIDQAESTVVEAKRALGDYKKSEKYKRDQEDPDYLRRKEQAEKEILGLEDRIKSRKDVGGLAGAMAAQQAQLAEGAAKAAAAQLEARTLSMFGMGEMFADLHLQEQLAHAGDKLKEKIKQIHLSKIFTDGAKKLADAAEKWDSGDKRAFDNLHAGAQAIKAEVEATYDTDLATTAKGRLTDVADDFTSMERFGFGTPKTAFKNLIKKRMEETFNGVEREQAVTMALGSLERMIAMKERGEKLGADHEAQMMANINYLTKQAWSDDLLARIVNRIREKKSLHGADREQAEAMEQIFVKRLKWLEKDSEGNLKGKNISDYQRTNELHRLSAFAGDADLMQSENAVLRKMRASKSIGKELGYMESAKALTNDVQAQMSLVGARNISAVTAAQWTNMAKNLGMAHVNAGEELQIFAKRFMQAGEGAAEGFKKVEDVLADFKREISYHGEANEHLADFKNLAVAVAHIDDGGHTYYDMKDKIARGQLWEDARDFVISDWIKVDGGKRLSSLKIHSIAKMDEDTGTASNFDPKTILATFEGAISKYMLQRMDVRTQRQIIKNSSSEAARNNKSNGRLIVADNDSVLVKGTYGKEENPLQAALKDVAQDWGTWLSTKPEVLFAMLGNYSGVSYESAMREGKLHIQIGDGDLKEDISDLGGLLNWLKKQGVVGLSEIEIRKKLQAAAYGDKAGKGQAEEENYAHSRQ